MDGWRVGEWVTKENHKKWLTNKSAFPWAGPGRSSIRVGSAASLFPLYIRLVFFAHSYYFLFLSHLTLRVIYLNCTTQHNTVERERKKESKCCLFVFSFLWLHSLTYIHSWMVMNMAKREKVEDDSLPELKQRLLRLVKTMVETDDDDDDDCTVKTADEAIATLSALKDLKCSRSRSRTRSLSDKLDDFALPPEFRCPISTQLMTDPVILSTGQV